MTDIIPEIIDEPARAGCAPGNETIGYLAGEISRLRSLLKADNEAREKTEALMKTKNDLLEWAWGVIANAGPSLGDWDGSDPKWKEVAIAWRDSYFTSMREEQA